MSDDERDACDYGPEWGRGLVTHVVPVPVADLLRWADQIDGESGSSDAVAAALRAHASCPTGDLTDAVERVRAMGSGGGCCTARHRCAYHEGWNDALDRFEYEL